MAGHERFPEHTLVGLPCMCLRPKAVKPTHAAQGREIYPFGQSPLNLLVSFYLYLFILYYLYYLLYIYIYINILFIYYLLLRIN